MRRRHGLIDWELLDTVLFLVMMVAGVIFLCKMIAWVLFKGIPWLLGGICACARAVGAGIARAFGWAAGRDEVRAMTSGRPAMSRSEYLRLQKVLQEKTLLACGVVEGTDPILARKALDQLCVYAKQGCALAALHVSRAIRNGEVVPQDDQLADKWYAFYIKLQERAQSMMASDTAVEVR